MATPKSRQVVSRRARPAKSPLSQEAIVATALDLLSREGMAGLSLRKVAAALDTGAASLYVYVANLDELHALVLDRVLGKVVTPPERDGDWRYRLKATLRSYSEALYRDVPGWLRSRFPPSLRARTWWNSPSRCSVCSRAAE